MAQTEEAGAMGRGCEFHQLLALQLQVVEHHQLTSWQVWMLFSTVPCLSKLHLASCEERGTQEFAVI